MLIMKRGIPSILRTATLIIGCLFQRIKQDVGELHRQKPLPSFSDFSPPSHPRCNLGSLPFFVSFFVECPQGNLQRAQQLPCHPSQDEDLALALGLANTSKFAP
jgi:hypothetical protein